MGFSRCCAIISRTERTDVVSSAGSSGTTGGGGGIVSPRIRRTIQNPRLTGLVRSPGELWVRKAAMGNRPPRVVAPRIVDAHPHRLVARTLRHAVVTGQGRIDERVVAVDQIQHRPVVPERVLHHPHRLFEHRLPQLVVERGKPHPVHGVQLLEPAELEPVAGELGRHPLTRGSSSIRRAWATRMRRGRAGTSPSAAIEQLSHPAGWTTGSSSSGSPARTETARRPPPPRPVRPPGVSDRRSYTDTASTRSRRYRKSGAIRMLTIESRTASTCDSPVTSRNER